MDLAGEVVKRSAPIAQGLKSAAPIAVVMFGSPGSGKGTQSKFLVQWLKIPQISTGDMLRDHIRRGTEIGQSIQVLMSHGTLVSDELVNRLVEDRIAQPDCSKGFILDGYPRTTAQARQMLKLLGNVGAEEVVIHLVVDYNIIIGRMQGRRVCLKCGTLYNSITKPPKIDSICDLDGETLVVREDDREEVVRERLHQYEAQTRPVIEYFRNSGARLLEVDASKDRPEVVFGRIQDMLEGIVAVQAPQ